MTDILTTMETVEKYTPSFSTAFKIGRNAGAARNESYKGLFGIQRAGLGRNSMAWQANRAGYQNKMDSVKAARKTMSAPKKLVSLGAQYPARTIGGTAAVGGTGYGIDRKVRKNDNVSAFGVEISKKKDVRKDPEYRKSYLEPLNPRSETYVRRGSGVARIGGPYIGGMAGGVGGAALGAATKNPNMVAPASFAGGVIGATPGLMRNVKSGDTVGIHRKTGKRAKAKAGTADMSFYSY